MTSTRSPLDVAIIGGGAAGMATAWLLDATHHVTVFESAPMLGGHIRTLNGNVPCDVLPSDLRIDCGVIEFARDNFPAFLALLADLEIEPEVISGGTTALYFNDGRQYVSPGAIDETSDLTVMARELLRLIPMALRRRRFIGRAREVAALDLYEMPVAAFLDDTDFSVWLKSLLTYAYSTDYDEVDELSAAIAVPMLCRYLRPNHWLRIPGGVYRYIAEIRERLRGEVVVACPIASVRRGQGGAVVTSNDGGEHRFDAVVLATGPDRLRSILADPSDDERRWFDAWSGDRVTTLVHTDTGLYERRGVRQYSEFDLFETPSGAHGYNAYLNRLCAISGPEHYGLAFHIDEEIAPERIVHRQDHDVAHYTVEALRHRPAVRARNGERSTYFVGAWLSDGLHEGAVRSALEVSQLLGGKQLRYTPDDELTV